MSTLSLSQLARMSPEELAGLFSVNLLWDHPKQPMDWGLLKRVGFLTLDEREVQADLSQLTGLPGLKHLTLYPHAERKDLRALPELPKVRDFSMTLFRGGICQVDGVAALSGLTGLRVDAARVGLDLGPVSALKKLTSITVRAALSRSGLKPLAGLAALETVDVERCGILSSLGALQGLKALRRLSLSGCAHVSDLSPLSGLTALENLNLSGCRGVTDLSALAGLTSLRFLDLEEIHGDLDLSPLAGLSKLSTLTVDPHAKLTGLSTLANCEGLRSNITFDKQGWARQWRKRLQGNAMLVALSAGADLSGSEHLKFKDCASLTDLSAVARLTGVKTLTVRSCPNLTEGFGILALTALTRLDLGRCPALKPVPDRRLMESVAEIDDYRRKLARALSRKADRTPAQEALLKTAAAAGLLEAVKKAPKPDTIAPIRKLLTSKTPAVMKQGMEILRTLNDPAVYAALSEGLSVEEGQIALSTYATRTSHLRPRDRRMWIALSLLQLTGGLDGVASLRFREAPMYDLVPLTGLTGLRSLHIDWSRSSPITDLQPLSGLTGLTSLLIERSIDAVIDLTPLSGLSALRSLSLGLNIHTDLSPLFALTDLQHLLLKGRQEKGAPPLEMAGMAQLTRLESLELAMRPVGDLSPLAGLTGLKTLLLRRMYTTDLAPLAGLTGIEELFLQLPWEQPVDLTPLAGMTGMKKLTLRGVGGSSLAPLAGMSGLERLELSGVREAAPTDLTPILGLETLSSLHLSANLASVTAETFAQFPNLRALYTLTCTGLPRYLRMSTSRRDALLSRLGRPPGSVVV